MEIKEIAEKLKDNIEKVIVGKTEEIRLLLTAVLADGHVLLEDVPGTGKTVLAKSLARSLDVSFGRIQFTPDLLPSDVTGINYYNQKEQDFVFRAGPVFANVILGDELNRATPRTQASMLECMAERQVTIDGKTVPMAKPFLVIATQNPLETAGTFPLPEAQLDRFLMKLSVGYPAMDQEKEILHRYMDGNPLEELKPVCTKEQLLDMQSGVRKIFVHEQVQEYLLRVAEESRKHEKLLAGASPRASLDLLRASQAYAAINGREFVLPEDIKYLAPYVLGHRVVVCPSYDNPQTGQEIVAEILGKVPVPTEAF